MIINAQVNQADVPRLRRRDGGGNGRGRGRVNCNGMVERIYPQATIKNNIKGYPARIALKNPDPASARHDRQRQDPGGVRRQRDRLPLAAVFTEKSSEGGPMERSSMCSRGCL